MESKYDADHKEMFKAADGSCMCETHPGHEWPHGDCLGPGMPWTLTGRTLIEEVLAGKFKPHGQCHFLLPILIDGVEHRCSLLEGHDGNHEWKAKP